MTRRTPRLLGLAAALSIAVALTFVARASGSEHRIVRSGAPRDAALSPVLRTLASLRGGRLGAHLATRLGVATAGPGSLELDASGQVLVTARMAWLSAATLHQLQAAGGHVTYVDAPLRTVTLDVAPRSLDSVAAVQGVRYVEEVLAPMTDAVCPVGAVVTEGDTQLDVAAARAKYHLNGAGVTVGIVSNSFNALGGASTDVRAASLPGTGNPCGYTTPVRVLSDGAGGDEGRAMAEIVHQLAPGARLLFASGDGGDAKMAAAILELAHDGARVIVDDMAYYDEPIYQESQISAAIDKVRSEGVTYFSSSGDSNQVVAGRDVGSYEARSYRATACPAAVAKADPGSLSCYNFAGPGYPANPLDTISFSGSGTLQVILGWDQPEGGITTDLDVALVNEQTGAVQTLDHSDNFRSEQAFQFLSSSISPGNFGLVVIKHGGVGAPRFKLLMMRADNLSGVQYDKTTAIDTIGPTLFGHNGALGASSVAAVPYYSDSIAETYSTRGPVTYCFAAVTTARPARALPRCVSKQVDIAATDGSQSAWFGHGTPLRFWGTSASAPHAAAVAALQLQYRPCASPATIIAGQARSGRKVGAYGAGAVGNGLLDAVTAIAATRCGQHLTFAALPNRPLTDASFDAATDVSASSHLAVRLASQTGRTCRVAVGDRVVLLRLGSCSLRATQSGNLRYAAAAPVTRTFTIESGAAVGTSLRSGRPRRASGATPTDAAARSRRWPAP